MDGDPNPQDIRGVMSPSRSTMVRLAPVAQSG